MTAPISAQLWRGQTILSNPTPAGYREVVYEDARLWHRQKPPYDLPLNWTYQKRTMISYQAGTSDRGDDPYYRKAVSILPYGVGTDSATYNKAYQRFKDKIRDDASVGLALAERRQAMTMMGSRLMQVARFTNALRRLRFGDAAKELGVHLPVRKLRKMETRSRSRDPRKRARSFANNYLEFHFGWSPLMADIYNAAEVLSSPVWPRPISASSKRWAHDYSGSGLTTWDINQTSRSNHITDEWQTTLRASFLVTNPNLLLGEQLGLINPATIAYETVPFSFILDWFVNVGDFLSSFTDFAGVQLTNPHTTTFFRRHHSEQELTLYNIGRPPRTPVFPTGSYSSYVRWHGMAIATNRVVGSFSGPTLRVRDPWVLSPRRGLAAVSLLIQSMPKTEVQAARPVISRKKGPYRGRLAESYWHL